MMEIKRLLLHMYSAMIFKKSCVKGEDYASVDRGR